MNLYYIIIKTPIELYDFHTRHESDNFNTIIEKLLEKQGNILSLPILNVGYHNCKLTVSENQEKERFYLFTKEIIQSAIAIEVTKLKSKK